MSFAGVLLILAAAGSENERTISREALLRDLAGGSDTVTSAHNEDMEVHGFGGTAVVTGWLVVRGRGAGGPYEHRYRFTDTWMRRAGRWQIVAAHDYLAPK
jgi:ketosteroid isomerase-like protein